MAKWYKEQKRKSKDWHKYIGVWIKDQWSHIQLQDVLLLLIILGFIFSLIAAKHGWLQLYHGSYTDHTEQLYLFSSIPQTLAAILALTFSLTILVFQHISSNYNPIVYRIQTFSIYYILFFGIFLFTIGYSIYLNGRFNSLTDPPSNFEVDALELLFFLALAFMIPFSYRSIKLMQPAEIMKRLSWKITMRRFRNYDLNLIKNKVEQYLQPSLDILIALIRKNDLYSFSNSIENFSIRISNLIRRCENKKSLLEITSRLIDIYGIICNKSYSDFNVSIYQYIIKSLDSILLAYNKNINKNLIFNFEKLFNEMEGEINGLISNRNDISEQNLRISYLKLGSKIVITPNLKDLDQKSKEKLASLSRKLGGEYKKLTFGNRYKNLNNSIKYYELALQVWNKNDYPEQYKNTINEKNKAQKMLNNFNHNQKHQKRES